MGLQPTMQKVPAQRGMGLIVGLAALAVLGVLVVRPWDSQGPQASLVGQAQASPFRPTAATIPSAQPPATPPRAFPTPDIAPLGPLGDVALLTGADQALVQCHYGPERRGTRRLVSVEVLSPVVMLDPGASETHIKRIGWWFELELNHAQNVFDRAWQRVGRSRSQSAPAVHRQPARFTPLTLPNNLPDIDDNAVFRVRVIVEWYTRNVELAGRAEIVANRYQEAGNELIDPWPMYCHGTLIASR